MAAARARFPFEFVIMLGDNMYGRQQPQDFVDKFEQPYAALLQAGVCFYAALGNHDNPANRVYKGSTWAASATTPSPGRTSGSSSSTATCSTRAAGVDRQHAEAVAGAWKICYFHHPLYSDGGRHGSDVALRVALEPLLVRYGVNVVFSGHDHVYERIKPQKGITYFVDGSGGQLRKGDVRPSATTAAFFDQDQAFMLVEIAGDEMFFQAVRAPAASSIPASSTGSRETVGPS